MRHRRTLLAGIAACTTALAASAAASADTVTYTTPGLTTVTLPAGVTSVHVVAVGGRGGGVQGGHAAVVTADLSLATPTGPANAIRVFVGGNGAIGAAGANGGGGTPTPSLAAGGGGWSGASPCTQMLDGRCSLFVRELVAGGGGGAGADGLPGTGGAGGSAGATGGSGSTTPLLAAADGGSIGSGGSGGVSGDPNCGDGGPGGDPTTGLNTTGGTGGVTGSLDGHGDGGGGGGGSPSGSGGGGGAGAWCTGNTGASGAGGGGGASVVPAGGQLALDTTGVPSVTLTYTPEQPTVTIATPADGNVYAQGSAVSASYACAASSPAFPIASCDGPVAAGDAIDTATLGLHTFAVSATDAIGMTAGMTVQYRVTDQTAPRVSGLRIAPRSIDATRRAAHATVRFKLSERASVRVTIVPVRRAKGRRARAVTETVAGHAGSNSFRLQPRVGRRTLAAGTYRLTLVATDPFGNRSRAVGQRFTIVG
ncbi:MAG TPA: hypothetical protein VFF79_19665 [Conexibacter sp.]|jgi:hypothetical protein|nr:hypothetical protein [Conexibacter sp.]